MMPTRPDNLSYIYTLLFSIILLTGATQVRAQATSDTTTNDTTKAHHNEPRSRQLMIGFDIAGPAKNYFYTNQKGYEFAADYYLRNELYLAAEAGWGNAQVSYSDLRYTTKNSFLRVGFNKVLLPRETTNDWGGLFLGLRLGAAAVKRSASSFDIIDSLWGNASGTVSEQTFVPVWLEVTSGVRLELFKGVFAGWNIRGKFMMNSKQFNALSPLYIAGYGKGDKNAVFDLNFYLSYALRWDRKSQAIPKPPAK